MRHYFCLVLIFIASATFAQTAAPASSTVLPATIRLTTLDSTEVAGSAVWGGKTKRPTLLAFWLTTCPPCMVELDTYQKNYAEWQRQANFQLVAISVDFPQRFRQVGRIARQKGLTFPTYWDRERTFKTLLPGGLNGLPQVFLFDKNGRLVWQHKGFRPGDEKEVFAKIKEYQ